jgi:uncharacterized protein
MKFEWDPIKNRLNIKKHGLSFEESAYVFTDKNNLSIYDDDHSDNEDRWITLGQIPFNQVIVVVHTVRHKNNTEYIRIISSRSATKKEADEYFIRR